MCRIEGLTGTQGVMMPASNVEDLMLREDILEAVGGGEISHLAGGKSEAGNRDFDGKSGGRAR